MKHRYLAFMAIVSAWLVAVSMTLVAQNRATLKSPNGIAFSEVNGFETWPVIATSQPDDAGGCGTSKTGCMKAIVGNAVMMKAFADGIPANGQPVPDGAAMAKIEWEKTKNTASPYGVTVPGPQTEVGFMIKDSKRFPETNGWGYATFQYVAASNTFKPATSDPAVMRTLCHSCHVRGAKAHDFVYTSYARR